MDKAHLAPNSSPTSPARPRVKFHNFPLALRDANVSPPVERHCLIRCAGTNVILTGDSPSVLYEGAADAPRWRGFIGASTPARRVVQWRGVLRMDGTRFDALVRDAHRRTDRRAALKGLVGGLLGLGIGARADVGTRAAEVAAAGCKVQTCRKQTLNQSCTDRRGNPDNHQCCEGLKCSNKRGVCVWKNSHGGPGDYCRTTNDCDRDYFCKKNQCIPNSCEK